MTERCRAVVSEPPHYFHHHGCPNKAKHDIDGIKVCGIHKKVAEKWQSQNRLHTMVEAWWPERWR
jgi:hypothetical protein